MVIPYVLYLHKQTQRAMTDLLKNIESLIHNQVIELGNFEPGMNYYDDLELESEGKVYIADFYIDAKIGDEGETNTYEIDIIYIALNLENEDKVLYNKNDSFKALEIFNPNN